jgi:hypothetical protein
MWIPSHVGLESIELVNERARLAALNCAVLIVHFQDVAKPVLLREWQGNWHVADTSSERGQ